MRPMGSVEGFVIRVCVALTLLFGFANALNDNGDLGLILVRATAPGPSPEEASVAAPVARDRGRALARCTPPGTVCRLAALEGGTRIMKREDAGRSSVSITMALALTSLAVLALLALSACGGSSTTASTSAAPSQAAASPSPSWSPTMSPAPIPVVKPGDKLPPFSELEAMFAYDASQPLGLETTPAEPQPGCTVDAIWFDVGDNQATGYLVTPQGEGPFPVVVYAPGWQTDVMMFMDDAVALARKGYAGLLLQEPAWATYWSFDPEADLQAVVQTVTQARRGLDLLATLPRSTRSASASSARATAPTCCGGVLAGVDERVKAYVLIGMARPASNYRGLMEDATPTGKAWDRIAAQLALWDPVTYLGHNRGSAFLLLNGNGDSNAMQDGKAFVAAAPDPNTWKVYSGGHSATPAANRFWQAWMLKNL